MGIPTFFKKIVKDDPNLILENVEVDNFYIDFNSIVYTVIRNTVNDVGLFINEMSPKEFEDMLLPNIIVYLKYIISQVKINKLLYIAVDGVPPMAKIVKQRSRRYKSLIEINFRSLLEKKYKTIVPHNKWSSASISPGTVFMDKLTKLISKSILTGLNEYSFKIIFDHYKIPGEGEHKIIKHIRNINEEVSCAVYSPDADLIVLLLMLNKSNLYVLRAVEDLKTNSGKGTEKGSDIDSVKRTVPFVFLSIDKCKTMFLQNIGTGIDAGINTKDGLSEFEQQFETKYDTSVIIDYAFMTFMCGNDFVSSPSFLKIKENGLELLESAYKKVIDSDSDSDNGNLVVNGLIHMENFKLFVKELADQNQVLFQKMQKKRHRISKSMSEYEYTFQEEYTRFQHEEYFSPGHPQNDQYGRLFDRINYYDNNWNEQYNKYFELDSKDLKHCKDYMDSLQFCLDYYTDSNNWSWNYFYKYRAPPTFCDLYKYLNDLTEKSSKETIEDSNKESVENKPLKPFQLLMIILPRQLFYLLPKELKDILNKREYDKYYPLNCKLDVVQGNKYIYSEVLLEHPTNIPIEIVNSIRYSKIDYMRNIEKVSEW